MTDTLLSARQVYDSVPLDSVIRFSDGTTEPPVRHRRKHATWASTNATGRLVRKAPAKHVSAASFALHVGDFGSTVVTVVKAYRVFTVSSPLSYTILESGQFVILEDENETPTLIHLADTEADARNWLEAHSHPKARIVPADAAEPRTFTYPQDADHGWLIVSHADLVSAGMTFRRLHQMQLRPGG